MATLPEIPTAAVTWTEVTTVAWSVGGVTTTKQVLTFWPPPPWNMALGGVGVAVTAPETVAFTDPVTVWVPFGWVCTVPFTVVRSLRPASTPAVLPVALSARDTTGPEAAHAPIGNSNRKAKGTMMTVS